LRNENIWKFLLSLDLPLADEVVAQIAAGWAESLLEVYTDGYLAGINDCMPEPHPGV
jgi:hypothetical protein